MDESEAFKAADSLRAKGWRFEIYADRHGWNCVAVGAGLANASGSGQSIGAAISSALKRALAMEDDPKVVLARYEAEIRQAVADVFGDGSLIGISPEPDPDQSYPHSHYIIARVRCGVAAGDDKAIKEHVSREREFYALFNEMPDEIRFPLRLETEFRETTERRTP